MADYGSHVSHSILTIRPKDREGGRINIRDAVVPAGSFNRDVRKIKEWAALAAYMKSFPDTDQNGIPDIPVCYGTTEGRLISEPS